MFFLVCEFACRLLFQSFFTLSCFIMGCFWSCESVSDRQSPPPSYSSSYPPQPQPRSTYNGVWSSERQCYGEFKCFCGRWWNSTRAWASVAQHCEKCGVPNLPFSTRPLTEEEKRADSDKQLQHKQELCGKCRMLGRLCTTTTGGVRAASSSNTIASSRSLPPSRGINFTPSAPVMRGGIGKPKGYRGRQRPRQFRKY